MTYEDLARYAAGDLAAEDAARVREHAAACAHCSRRLGRLRQTDALLAGIASAAPPVDALLATRKALRAEIMGPQTPEVMTLEQVADYLQIAPEELDEALWDLPAFEVAGRLRVRRSQLAEWMQKRERAFAAARTSSEVSHILHAIATEEISHDS
jgi:hypothetical protein